MTEFTNLILNKKYTYREVYEFQERERAKENKRTSNKYVNIGRDHVLTTITTTTPIFNRNVNKC